MFSRIKKTLTLLRTARFKMALKQIENTVINFEVNEDLVTELRAAPVTCTARPVNGPANDIQVMQLMERMRRESLYVA